MGVGSKLQLTIVSVLHLKCMWYKLTDTYVHRSLPSHLCMPEPFLWDLASLVNARQGDRVIEDAWLILSLQDLVYNCNDVSAIEALNA